MKNLLRLLALGFGLWTLESEATQVLFPINSMFGGAAYGRPITVTAVNALYTDGQNLYGGTYTSIPSTGTNPIVNLQPNDYLLTLAGVVRPARFTVPASTNLLNLVTSNLITSGPVFWFGTNGFANLTATNGLILITNSDGSLTIGTSPLPVVFTNTLDNYGNAWPELAAEPGAGYPGVALQDGALFVGTNPVVLAGITESGALGGLVYGSFGVFTLPVPPGYSSSMLFNVDPFGNPAWSGTATGWVAGADVVGTVTNAKFAQVATNLAGIITGSQVIGPVTNALIAGTASNLTAAAALTLTNGMAFTNSASPISAPNFYATGSGFTGNGSGLTGVTAANVSGILTNSLSGPNVSVTMGAGSLSGLSLNVSTATAANFTGGTFTGNGGGLTNLSANNIALGQLGPIPPAPYAHWAAWSLTGMTNGQAVTNWPDLSGNGFNLTGSGATYSVSALNGKPGINFAAGGWLLTNSTCIPAVCNTNFTIIVALRDPLQNASYTTPGSTVFAITGPGTGSPYAEFDSWISYNATYDNQCLLKLDSDGNQQFPFNSSLNTGNGQPLVAAWRYDGYGIMSYGNGYQEESPYNVGGDTCGVLSPPCNLVPSSGGGLFLGTYGAGHNFQGFISEIWIYTNAIPLQQFQWLIDSQVAAYCPAHDELHLAGDSILQGPNAGAGSNFVSVLAPVLVGANVFCDAHSGIWSGQILYQLQQNVGFMSAGPGFKAVAWTMGGNDFNTYGTTPGYQTNVENTAITYALTAHSNNIAAILCVQPSNPPETNGAAYVAYKTWCVTNGLAFADCVVDWSSNTNWGQYNQFTNTAWFGANQHPLGIQEQQAAAGLVEAFNFLRYGTIYSRVGTNYTPYTKVLQTNSYGLTKAVIGW